MHRERTAMVHIGGDANLLLGPWGLRLAEPGACCFSPLWHTEAESESSPVCVSAQGGLGLNDPTVDLFLLGGVHLRLPD